MWARPDPTATLIQVWMGLAAARRVLKNVGVEIGGQARHSQGAQSATPWRGMKDAGTQ